MAVVYSKFMRSSVGRKLCLKNGRVAYETQHWCETSFVSQMSGMQLECILEAAQ